MCMITKYNLTRALIKFSIISFVYFQTHLLTHKHVYRLCVYLCGWISIRCLFSLQGENMLKTNHCWRQLLLQEILQIKSSTFKRRFIDQSIEQEKTNLCQLYTATLVMLPAFTGPYKSSPSPCFFYCECFRVMSSDDVFTPNNNNDATTVTSTPPRLLISM